MIIGTAFIVAFTAALVPKIIFRLCACVMPVRAQVYERFSDAFGEVVVYKSSAAARKYIKSYRVGRNSSGLYFRGEWETKAACVEYRLTAYGANDGIIDILRVKEKFNCGKYTADVALPEGTDYVTLTVLCADDNPLPLTRRPLGAGCAVWTGVLCLYLSAACDVLLWLVLTFILRCKDNFTMTYDFSAAQWAAILGFTALAVTAVTALVSVCLLLCGKKEEVYDG